MNILNNIAFVLCFVPHLHAASNAPAPMDVDAGDGAVDENAPTPRNADPNEGIERAPSYHGNETDMKRGYIPPAVAASTEPAPHASVTELPATPLVPLSEDLAKKLAQLQANIMQALRVQKPKITENNYKIVIDRLLNDFNHLQQRPWEAQDIAHLMQHVAAQPSAVHLSEAERKSVGVCKATALETLSAAFVLNIQAQLSSEGEIKRNAEPLKTMLTKLPANLLEQLARTCMKRDPQLVEATKYVRLTGDMTLQDNCACKDTHKPCSPHGMIMNAWRSAIGAKITNAAEPSHIPAPVVGIIMDYADYFPQLSLSELMSYRNFDLVLIRPQHGAPFAADDANTLDLSHNGLTDLNGLERVARRSRSDSSAYDTLGEEILRLRLNCNHLTDIPSLHIFEGCATVDLSNNKITLIKPGTFREGCQTVLLANNCLSSIPEDIMVTAEQRKIAGYQINYTVDLSGNPLLKSEIERKKIDQLRAMGATVLTDTPAPALPQHSKPG